MSSLKKVQESSSGHHNDPGDVAVVAGRVVSPPLPCACGRCTRGTWTARAWWRAGGRGCWPRRSSPAPPRVGVLLVPTHVSHRVHECYRMYTCLCVCMSRFTTTATLTPPPPLVWPWLAGRLHQAPAAVSVVGLCSAPSRHRPLPPPASTRGQPPAHIANTT